jgi:hypothetical protein
MSDPLEAPRDPARPWMLALLALGIAARAALTAGNPPHNTFDDHYEPVFLALKNGAMPGKLDCWQCYHPPVMYALSTAAARGCEGLHLSFEVMLKTLQGLNCAFGIGALLLVYSMLRRTVASAFARAAGFAFFALLPRHLYMSAMFANDAAATFFIILTAWACVRWLRGGGPWICALAGCAATAAIFTKYTAFAVLPMMAAAIAAGLRGGTRKLAPMLLALLLPAASLAASMADNLHRYGAALPHNARLYDPGGHQARDDPRGMRFTTFEPWLFVQHPIVRPGQLSSFWTLLQAGLYFDEEPRFSLFLGDRNGWQRYYDWLNGRGPDYPGVFAPAAFLRMGSALEALGLFWLAAGATGLVLFARRRAAPRELVPLFVLLGFTVAGVAWLVHLMPVVAAVKASYLLGAAPAMTGLIVVGLDSWANRRPLRRAAVICAALYVAVSLAHIVYWLIER